eukprot:745639-Prymnesium_polylepis.1
MTRGLVPSDSLNLSVGDRSAQTQSQSRARRMYGGPEATGPTARQCVWAPTHLHRSDRTRKKSFEYSTVPRRTWVLVPHPTLHLHARPTRTNRTQTLAGNR